MHQESLALLAADELDGSLAAGISAAGDLELVPPRADNPPPDHHSDRGRYSQRWAYYDADGRFESYVDRFETASGKEFRPLRHGRLGDLVGWHRKGWGKRRPPYRLREARAAPALPVLVVEGEKTADAAAALVPGYAVVTSMGGADSPRETDWTFLAGRHVVIWPDNDKAGRKFALAVADLARTVGAASVRIVAVPPGAPEGWDLADGRPTGWTDGTIPAALLEPEEEFQRDFRVVHRPGGLMAPGIYRLEMFKVEQHLVEE